MTQKSSKFSIGSFFLLLQPHKKPSILLLRKRNLWIKSQLKQTFFNSEDFQEKIASFYCGQIRMPFSAMKAHKLYVEDFKRKSGVSVRQGVRNRCYDEFLPQFIL